MQKDYIILCIMMNFIKFLHANIPHKASNIYSNGISANIDGMNLVYPISDDEYNLGLKISSFGNSTMPANEYPVVKNLNNDCFSVNYDAKNEFSFQKIEDAQNISLSNDLMHLDAHKLISFGEKSMNNFSKMCDLYLYPEGGNFTFRDSEFFSHIAENVSDTSIKDKYFHHNSVTQCIPSSLHADFYSKNHLDNEIVDDNFYANSTIRNDEILEVENSNIASVFSKHIQNDMNSLVYMQKPPFYESPIQNEHPNFNEFSKSNHNDFLNDFFALSHKNVQHNNINHVNNMEFITCSDDNKGNIISLEIIKKLEKKIEKTKPKRFIKPKKKKIDSIKQLKIAENQLCVKNTKYLHDFISDSLNYYRKFENIYVNLEFDEQNFVFLEKIMEIVIEKKDNVEIEIQNSTWLSNNSRKLMCTKNILEKGFCLFCGIEECPASEMNFRSTFDYEILVERLITANPKSMWIQQVKVFFNDIERIQKRVHKFDIKSFIITFSKQRKVFLHVFRNIFTVRLKLCSTTKLEILRDLFHRFKSHHLDLKLRLIPELHSLIFLILNRGVGIYYYQNNRIFCSIYFFFRSLEMLFNIISQEQIFERDEMKYSERKVINSLYFSLFIRINFMEPLIYIVTRKNKIIQKYRLHFMTLFKMEYLFLKNELKDEIMLNSLRLHLCWICVTNKSISNTLFLNHYKDNCLGNIFEMNYEYITEFISTFNIYDLQNPKLLLESMIKRKDYYHLTIFAKFYEEWKHGRMKVIDLNKWISVYTQ